jgi:transposase
MALVLVDMHGLSIAEAASILDVAQGTIKSRCARGRAASYPRRHSGRSHRPRCPIGPNRLLCPDPLPTTR